MKNEENHQYKEEKYFTPLIVSFSIALLAMSLLAYITS